MSTESVLQYYGLEARPINKSQIKSLDFVLNIAFRKIFLTKSYDVANECILFFSCSVSDAIYTRKLKFLTKLQCKTVAFACMVDLKFSVRFFLRFRA